MLSRHCGFHFRWPSVWSLHLSLSVWFLSSVVTENVWTDEPWSFKELESNHKSNIVVFQCVLYVFVHESFQHFLFIYKNATVYIHWNVNFFFINIWLWKIIKKNNYNTTWHSRPTFKAIEMLHSLKEVRRKPWTGYWLLVQKHATRSRVTSPSRHHTSDHHSPPECRQFSREPAQTLSTTFRPKNQRLEITARHRSHHPTHLVLLDRYMLPSDLERTYRRAPRCPTGLDGGSDLTWDWLMSRNNIFQAVPPTWGDQGLSVSLISSVAVQCNMLVQTST